MQEEIKTRKSKFILSFLVGLHFVAGISCSTGGVRSKANSKLLPISKKVLTGNDSFQKPQPLRLTEKEKLYFELAGEKVDKLSETEIYKKVIEKSQAQDLRATEAFVNTLLQRYPLSVYSENSLMILGQTSFTQRQYSKSLQAYNRLLSLYPLGAKVASAMFAKAILFERMNLKSQSQILLKDIKKRFPLSPEGLRANVEYGRVSRQ